MRVRCLTLAGLLTVLGPMPAGAEGAGFHDDLGSHDASSWLLQDGWVDGDWFRCGWNKDNVIFRGDAMTLVLDDAPSAGKPYSCGAYQSNEKFGYGRYEARMRVPKGSGLVSAFFVYTGPYYGDPWDEIDFEFLGKDTTQVQINWFAGADEPDHGKLIDLGFDASEDFHTYAFEWRPDSITWVVDGRVVHEVTADTATLPSHPGKIFATIWAGTNEGWLGAFEYEGPVSAEYESISYTPLPDLEPGAG